jgi:hypothetical protein
MDKIHVDIRVVGHTEEVGAFLRLLQYIEASGRLGAGADIQVSVDGDGSGRLGFFLIDEPGQKEKYSNLPTDKSIDAKVGDHHDLRIEIGE